MVRYLKGADNMLIFLLTFQTIVLCICILSHKMIEKRYKDIEESIIILNDSKAYRTEDKVCFIRDIIDRYRSYENIGNDSMQGKNVELKNMIQVDLLNSKIGKFDFIGVYNIATKIKILMRYSVLIEVLILYVNSELQSEKGIIVLIMGIGLAILTEIIVIIKALESRQESLILTIEEYILYKYKIELNSKEKVRAKNKNIDSKNIDSKNIDQDEIGINKEYSDAKLDDIEEEIKDNLNDKKFKSKVNNHTVKKIRDKDIANVIKSINMSKGKKYNSKIPD